MSTLKLSIPNGPSRTLETGAAPLNVGRRVPEGWSVQDITLSKEHFVVQSSADGFVLVDDRSTSGTYVNDNIVRGATPLSAGDSIRAGQTTFIVSIDEPV